MAAGTKFLTHSNLPSVGAQIFASVVLIWGILGAVCVFLVIPVLTLVLPYKFFVKLSLANQGDNKRSWLSSRLPAIIISVLNFPGSMVFATLSLSANYTGQILYRAQTIAFALCIVIQTLNFYILWYCVNSKKTFKS